MRISNVMEADAKPADQAKKEPKVEEYKGYKVVDDEVQPGWTDVGYYIPGYSSRSHVASLREEYKADAKKKEDAKKTDKEDGYSLKTPFTWGYNVFASLFTFIGDMFKGIFGLCINYEKEDAQAGEEAAKKADDKKTGTN